jgi:hypothetical protein
MRRLAVFAFSVLLGVASAGGAFAQSAAQKAPAKPGGQATPAPAKPAPAKPAPVKAPAKASDQAPLAFRGVVSFGLTSLASSRSFDAVAGTHSQATVGVGAEVLNIWKNVFAGVSYSPLGLSGQRVFVDSETVYPLGIPVDISVNSLDIVGGWRFVLKPKAAKPAPPKPGQKPVAPAPKTPQSPPKPQRLVPFVGGGLSMAMYKETSLNAGGDDVSKSASGFVVLGGVDYTLTKWIRVGGELRYRAVSGVLGTGGVSQVYGEKSLGGYVIAARVSVGK